MENRVALVTGSNRGIGYEIARQLGEKGWTVIATSRKEHEGRKAVERLRSGPGTFEAFTLDTSALDNLRVLDTWIQEKFGRLDVLVNNAGILIDGEASSLDTEIAPIETTMRTNVYGPLRLAQFAAGWMKRHRFGRIINVSSGMGQLSDMSGGYPAYRISKTALNAVTRMLAAELLGSGILVNSVCPGWVKTDMGGSGASREVAQGADTVVWLATYPQDQDGPTGGFFRDRKPIPW